MSRNHPHPTLRKKVLDQRAAMIHWSDLDFPAFLDTARQLLPDRQGDPRFDFVVYKLWREDYGQPRANFDAGLSARYDRFVKTFEWTVAGAPSWATASRILSTLRFWQPRYPAPLRAKHAVAIMSGLRDAFGLSHA